MSLLVTLAVFLLFRASAHSGSQCHHSADVDSSSGDVDISSGGATACSKPHDSDYEPDISVMLQKAGVQVTSLTLSDFKSLGDAPSQSSVTFTQDAEDNYKYPDFTWLTWPSKNFTGASRVDSLRESLKLKANDKGDLKAFISALSLNSVLVVMAVLTFSKLAQWYPVVYSDNANKGLIHKVPAGFFGWIRGSLGLTFDESERAAGLDAAMFIEFTELAIRLCVLIAIPKCLILCPLHFMFGDKKEFHDKLSRIGIGNLPDGSWVFWVHVAMLWYVVLLTKYLVHSAQDTFVKRRFAWMAKMPYPRATTVLVEGIPREYCTDEALRAFFGKLFSEDQVVAAYIIKKTDSLQKAVEDLIEADKNMAAAEFQCNRANDDEGEQPHALEFSQKATEELDQSTKLRREAAKLVQAERDLIEQNKDAVPCTNAGFVTFKRRRDAALAVYMKVDADDHIFEMSVAPDPADVIYSDFTKAGSMSAVLEVLGHLMCAGLFFAFTPIIVSISSLINLQVLEQIFPAVKGILERYPMLVPSVKGVLASASLTLVMSFLPSIFVLIFTRFFKNKAGQWEQSRLQQWYFYFQVCFIMIIPAVGASLIDMLTKLVDHPLTVVEMLARRLPSSTHFFMNYITMQWVTHGLNLTRYMQLTKFYTFSAFYEVDRAKQLSEPEDQDYYGMGGRSARFSLLLSIALVYCSLAPLIAILTATNFVLCRIIYGYLLVFAETPKPDLGGVFWVAQLKHIQLVLFIYVLLMFGVLAQRAATMGPSIAVLPAMLFLYISYIRFHTAYDWEFLSFAELVKQESSEQGIGQEKPAPRGTRDTYAQPELTEPRV